MKSKKVLILGSSGMLGSMILDFFSDKVEMDVHAMLRDEKLLGKYKNKYPEVGFSLFKEPEALPIEENQWVINCVGVIKQKIDEKNKSIVQNAIFVNSLFPYLLDNQKRKNTKIIQIATDCVFSGKKGLYEESDTHDPEDIYGKTKSLGEVNAENFYNIRTSIIGPDRISKNSLLEWFLSQKNGENLKGFDNHFWNGITTLHFAKLCHSLIESELNLPNTIHFIPKESVSKCELLNLFANYFKRSDIKIASTPSENPVNRTLSTVHDNTVDEVWNAMGYEHKPTIEEMVKELSKYVVERNFYAI